MMCNTSMRWHAPGRQSGLKTRSGWGSFLLLTLSLGTTGHAQQPTSLPSEPSQTAAARVEQALRNQDHAGAMREYRAMIAADPKNSQAWTGLGVLLYGSGQAAAAADALTSALHIDPLSSRAELFLALSQADMHACDEAIPVLEKHLHSEPEGKLQRLTGLTLLQCSTKSKDALSAVQAAAQLQQTYPGDPDVLYASAELYTRLWTETADELMTRHPDSYRVHQLAAEVNEAQGNLDQAIREYRTALEENPKLPQMHYRIGQLLLRAAAPDADEKAMAEFRAELATDPQSGVSALAIAEIERHQGKLTEARADYSLARKLEPDLADARVGLAQVMLAQHQVEASQAELKTVLAEHPDNAQAHYVMMLDYREQGKLPEAASEMAVFQRLQHDNADQFRKKLTALLTGSKQSPGPGSTSNP